VKPRSLWSTFADPFVLLHEFYGGKAAQGRPRLAEDESSRR
jgi:hypothetical protein